MLKTKSGFVVGALVVLLVSVAAGFVASGKQAVQDKIGQMHLVEADKTFQDFQSAPIVGTTRKMKLFDIPALGDSTGVFVNIPIDFSPAPAGNTTILIEGTHCNESHVIDLHPSDPTFVFGRGQFDVLFCDTQSPTSVSITGEASDVGAFTQGNMKVFAQYVVH